MESLGARRNRTTSKQLELSRKLRSIAVELGPGAKLPTARELCRHLQTSLATLDGVLHHLERSNTIARRQGSGIFVSPNLHQRAIAVVMESIYLEASDSSPFWGMLWGHFARQARLRSDDHSETVTFHLADTRFDSNSLPDYLQDDLALGLVDGLLLAGVNDTIAEGLGNTGTVIVSYACHSNYQVSHDARSFYEIAIRELARSGCKKIKVWTQASSSHISELPEGKISDIRFGFERAGFEFSEEDVLCIQNTIGSSLQEQGFCAAEAFLDQQHLSPELGLLISNDMIASGALRAMALRSVFPGVDLQVASHRNVGSPMLFRQDAVIQISVNPEEIVTSMFGLLDRTLSGESSDHERVLIQPQLMVP